MTRLPRPCVCLVTDRRQVAPDARTRLDEVRALDRWLDEALGVVDLIQIRERDLDGGEYCALSARVAARAKGTRTAVVVNDRADVARAAGADGVHARADGPPLDRLRAFAPPGWLIGRSVHDLAGVRAEAAADYLLFGTAFPSRSKGAGRPTQGLARLAEAAGATETPVLAIGGITPARAAECRAAGAAGVAAIGVFLPPGRTPEALGITGAAAALREAFAL